MIDSLKPYVIFALAVAVAMLIAVFIFGAVINSLVGYTFGFQKLQAWCYEKRKRHPRLFTIIGLLCILVPILFFDIQAGSIKQGIVTGMIFGIFTIFTDESALQKRKKR
ncbi:MAG: hypothetical protein LBN34_06140 [Clostridiales Family XIII bacterium]|jgi:accessory gene regulator protein AgrB|nr:hypothetical protein [Clostridiales Family XIII bacterium]